MSNINNMRNGTTQNGEWHQSTQVVKVARFEFKYPGDDLVEATLTVILSGYKSLSLKEDMYNVVYEDNTEQISMKHLSASGLLQRYGQAVYDARPLRKG